ncbi:MAG: 4Fe-4S dicluster domain-containing protein, partial [Proteobacteria bacterium]|nr:4Fe-4S dicluster domain-containing protein [Pseudomonadota bacterium]
VDEKKCVYCGKCAKACPMGAWIVNVKGKARKFDSVRCIGCGLCYVACDKEKAVELKAVEGYQVPMLRNVEGGADPLEGISGVREK